MIRFLTGLPRSGKSFFAVKEIIEKLSTPQPINPNTGEPYNFLILTNIDGITYDDARLIKMEFDHDFFKNTLIAPYLRNLRDEYKLTNDDTIYIYIDEAQRFFSNPEKDVEFFFDYHGHYGVDVVIITQNVKKISPKISALAEYEIRAAATSTNPFGSFVYKQLQEGVQFGTIRVRKDPKVFSHYKSFQAGQGKVPKSKLRWYALAAIAAAIITWFFFFRAFSDSFHIKGKSKPVEDVVLDDPAPFPVKAAHASVSPSSSFPNSMEPEKPHTNYLGPTILDFSPSKDSVKIESENSDLQVWISVSDFIKSYPPQIYGYGFFHCPHKRLVLMDAQNQNLIYPVSNPIFIRETFVQNVPVVEPIEPEVAYGTSFSGPGKTDMDGFTENDRVFMKYANLLSRGYNVKKPNFKQSIVETPVPPVSNSSIPSQEMMNLFQKQ